MSGISKTAMVLAAGFGSRMQPLTLHKPKPLFEVGGRTMLDHALDRLLAAGIKRVVVNTHYLGDQIAAHMAMRKDIESVISFEPAIMDTGGGVKQMLHEFGGQPFITLNADLPWFESAGSVPSLSRMIDFWDAGRMDALLLLARNEGLLGFDPAKGDFMLEADGRVWRQNAPFPRSHVWISAQIVKPECYLGIEEKIFSNNRIWNEAEAKNKLYGLEFSGLCYHVGTPHDLEAANAHYASWLGHLPK